MSGGESHEYQSAAIERQRDTTDNTIGNQDVLVTDAITGLGSFDMYVRGLAQVCANPERDCPTLREFFEGWVPRTMVSGDLAYVNRISPVESGGRMRLT